MTELLFDEQFFIPTDEEKISNLEKKIGYHFPEDYKKFLLKQNGGMFISHGAAINSYIVDYLYGIRGEKNDNDIYYDFINYGTYRYKKGFIAIGVDPSGDTFIMNCDKQQKGYGQIFFSENEYFVGDSGVHNVTFLAENFTDFLANIYDLDKNNPFGIENNDFQIFTILFKKLLQNEDFCKYFLLNNSEQDIKHPYTFVSSLRRYLGEKYFDKNNNLLIKDEFINGIIQGFEDIYGVSHINDEVILYGFIELFLENDRRKVQNFMKIFSKSILIEDVKKYYKKLFGKSYENSITKMLKNFFIHSH